MEQLDNGKDKDTNEEEDYKMATILGKCGGLDAILSRLSHLKEFVQGHPLMSAALKLLGYCVKLQANRQYLLNPHLNTLSILLGNLDQVGLGGGGCGVMLQANQQLSPQHPWYFIGELRWWDTLGVFFIGLCEAAV